MLKLPYPLEIDVAQARIWDALHAYSRSPTEANEKRVDAAMKRWRELHIPRDSSQTPPEHSDDMESDIYSSPNGDFHYAGHGSAAR